VLLSGSGRLAEAAAACEALSAVRAASLAEGRVELLVDGARRLLPEILRTAADAGASIDGVEVDEPNLEAVFLHLTGRALRD
jgi:ABC-2 type transport system ATP-binding protein